MKTTELTLMNSLTCTQGHFGGTSYPPHKIILGELPPFITSAYLIPSHH